MKIDVCVWRDKATEGGRLNVTVLVGYQFFDGITQTSDRLKLKGTRSSHPAKLPNFPSHFCHMKTPQVKVEMLPHNPFFSHLTACVTTRAVHHLSRLLISA